MRLTLRTLLAYLDDTLDAEDSELLARKIQDSTFAKELIDRIHRSVGDGQLSANSPYAIAPSQDANAISEYLDSTLTPPQIAEIERACLENEHDLAEAAACHQILTLVLSKPAEVPESLRQRIYRLPNDPAVRGDQTAGVAGSFSAVEIPQDRFDDGGLDWGADVPPDVTGDGLHDALTETIAPGHRSNGRVLPVGPDDSGVSDAPTRIRGMESSATSPRPMPSPTTAAKSRRIAPEYFAGDVRTSRITPWLVSLGLLGLMGFALTQAFSPILDQRAARRDANDGKSPQPRRDAEIEKPVVDAPIEEASPVSPSPSEPKPLVAADLAAPVTPPDPSAANASSAVAPQPAAESDADSNVATPDPSAEAAGVQPDASQTAVASAGAVKPSVQEMSESPAVEVEEVVPVDDQPTDASQDKPTPPLPQAMRFGELITDNTILLATSASGEFSRMLPSTEVVTDSELAVPPLYRPAIAIDETTQLTLVGPCLVTPLKSDTGQTSIELDLGAVIFDVGVVGSEVSLRSERHEWTVLTKSDDCRFACELTYQRMPGKDPRDPENRQENWRLIAITGSYDVSVRATGASKATTRQLTAGNDLVLSGASAAVTPVDPDGKGMTDPVAEALTIEPSQTVPLWTDPATEKLSTVQQGARDGLLEIVKPEMPPLTGLREAMTFRLPEVVALAAQALLLGGHPEVYFGVDGVFASSRQRLHWQEHFDLIQQVVDSSVERAQRMHGAIETMESVDLDTLNSLVVGFSQGQLKAGADVRLVDLLDSPSMAVRVLALENLRLITGGTVYFNPAETNTGRRAPQVKKWQVRAARGGIRYPE